MDIRKVEGGFEAPVSERKQEKNPCLFFNQYIFIYSNSRTEFASSPYLNMINVSALQPQLEPLISKSKITYYYQCRYSPKKKSKLFHKNGTNS
jgi:hypothetical protein